MAGITLESTMKVMLCALFCVFTLASVASAQESIQGQWAGDVEVEGGSETVQLAIRVDDDRVSGSVITPGYERSIVEASVNGALIEFTTTENRDGTEVRFKWTGTLSGDGKEIAFTITSADQSPAASVVVRRQAN